MEQLIVEIYNPRINISVIEIVHQRQLACVAIFISHPFKLLLLFFLNLEHSYKLKAKVHLL